MSRGHRASGRIIGIRRCVPWVIETQPQLPWQRLARCFLLFSLDWHTETMDDFWDFIESVLVQAVVWAFAMALLGIPPRRESLRSLKECLN